LNACANLQALEDGNHVHEHIIQSGCESNVFVGNSLMDMYAKCGALRMHGESSTTCPQGMLCLGMLSCLYMWNVGKSRKHRNYFDKWKRTV
jgi:hypothetical protein